MSDYTNIIVHNSSVLRAVQICVVLVMRIVTDVQSGVGLESMIGGEARQEAGIHLDVDKHAGGP